MVGRQSARVRARVDLVEVTTVDVFFCFSLGAVGRSAVGAACVVIGDAWLVGFLFKEINTQRYYVESAEELVRCQIKYLDELHRRPRPAAADDDD